MSTSPLARWRTLPRGTKRLVITALVALDAILGLLHGAGSLNLLDLLLFGNLPGDLVWLLQTVQLICTGFAVVKVVFDDLPPSRLRVGVIALSPILLLIHVLFSLEILLRGQGLSTTVNLDLASLGMDTLTWSATYLAIAVGCTLTYAVQRYGNFAQSEFFMVGMYAGVVLGWMEHVQPLVTAPQDGVLSWTVFLYALILGFLVSGFAGVVVDRLVFKGFRDRKASADVMMIASLGVALVLRGLLYLRFASDSKRFVPDADWMDGSGQAWTLPSRVFRIDLGAGDLQVVSEVREASYAFNNAIMPIVTFGTVIMLLLLLTRTRLGRRMRAVADNPELAASCGINVERVQMMSAFLSAGITGVGGTVFGLYVTFSPQTGFTLLLPAFAVIVLGTIGSISGTIVAALVIGFVRAVSSPVLIAIGNPLERTNYAAMAGVTPYLIIIAILLVLPKGLGDGWERWRIERLRSKATTRKEPNPRAAAALAVLFGWVGLHHVQMRKNARAVAMAGLTGLAWAVHAVSSFMREHSWAGRDAVAPRGMDAATSEAWLSLVGTEQAVLSTFGLLGDVMWPLIPLLVWAYALREAYLLNAGRLDEDPFPALTRTWTSFTGRLGRFTTACSEALSQGLGRITGLMPAAGGGAMPLNGSLDGLQDLLKGASSRLTEWSEARTTERGSTRAFLLFSAVLLLIILWLPLDGRDDWGFYKSLQVSNVLTTFAIFLLLAFSLNLHTGMTGLLNFGVIFFASIGAILVGILTAPEEYFGYDWPIFPAVLMAMVVGAAAGWLMAGPTARLRSDYFAIITISMGEVVRLLLSGEPLLRVGANASAIGIGQYPKPLNVWWFCGREPQLTSAGEVMSPVACSLDPTITSAASIVGEWLGFTKPAPYMLLLALLGIAAAALTWFVLSTLYRSPWGRVLRAIREDEDVAQHHGHDIMRHKAMSLAVGGAIAALAGALWAWKLGGFQPTFMSPARSTFLVWAAFIIGGAANNRGMIIGAMIIALMEFFFNVLVAAQGSSDLPLHGVADSIDALFQWSVLTPFQPAVLLLVLAAVMAFFRSSKAAETLGLLGLTMLILGVLLGGEGHHSITEVFPEVLGGVAPKMGFVKEVLVGLLIVFSLKFNAKGLLPEVPFRPDRPGAASAEVDE